MQITIDVEGLPDLQALWAQAPDITTAEMTAATWEAELLLEREIKDATPVGATGLLRSSISAHEPRVLAESVIGAVATSIAHALSVELGTKPHFPPLAPLEDWVVKKLDVSREDAPRVALAVARKIAARGTLAVGMFHRTFAAYQAHVERIYQTAHVRIVDRLGGA